MLSQGTRPSILHKMGRWSGATDVTNLTTATRKKIAEMVADLRTSFFNQLIFLTCPFVSNPSPLSPFFFSCFNPGFFNLCCRQTVISKLVALSSTLLVSLHGHLVGTAANPPCACGLTCVNVFSSNDVVGKQLVFDCALVHG